MDITRTNQPKSTSDQLLGGFVASSYGICRLSEATAKGWRHL